MDIIKTLDVAKFKSTEIATEGMIRKTMDSNSATAEDVYILASYNIRCNFSFPLKSISLAHLAMVIIVLILASGVSD